MSAYNLIFSKRWPASQVDTQPYRFAFLIGAMIGITSAALGPVVLVTMLMLFSPEVLGPSAATHLSGLDPVLLFFYAVLIIPFAETLIAQLIPLEIAKRIGFNEAACIITGGIIFGLFHYKRRTRSWHRDISRRNSNHFKLCDNAAMGIPSCFLGIVHDALARQHVNVVCSTGYFPQPGLR